MTLTQPRNELVREMVLQQALNPVEVESGDVNHYDGQPEDGVLPEEGCGGAPEVSHWGGL